MRFEIKHCSVLDAGADIIVNAANNYLSSGGGVCGAIFAKAGDVELEAECKEYGYVPTGSAAITNGLKTGAKYIIHAVGPSINIDKNDWQEKLASAYRNSLIIADDASVKSIAFPCISTGIFGCPIEEATHIALNVIANHDSKILDICYLCCFTEEEYKEYQRIGYLYNKQNFIDFAEISLCSPTTEEEKVKKTTQLDKFYDDMWKITWKDLCFLSKESLVNIPISWIWDWAHCTANYEHQELAGNLYINKGLPIITVKTIDKLKVMAMKDKENYISRLKALEDRMKLNE